MTDAAHLPEPIAPAAAAGWYPDATGRTRWWNGTNWAQYAPEKQTNGAATGSLVLGIVGVVLTVTLFLAPFAIPLIPAGLIVGIVGLRRARSLGGVGRKSAVAGVILCGVPVALFLLGSIGNTLN